MAKKKRKAIAVNQDEQLNNCVEIQENDNQVKADIVTRKSEAIENRKRFEANIKNIWNYSDLGLEAKKAAMTMLSTKTGMYAKVPIICKAEACPYAENCSLLLYDLAPYGEFCPIETAQIELRFAGYAEDFDFDTASFTDKCLISDIINCDIMLERCKALMAKEGVPVIDVVAGITESGEEFTQPQVSKYWEAYEKIQKRRNEMYQLMLATRKDKKTKNEEQKSLSEILKEAINVNEFIEDQKPDNIVIDVPKEC